MSTTLAITVIAFNQQHFAYGFAWAWETFAPVVLLIVCIGYIIKLIGR